MVVERTRRTWGKGTLLRQSAPSLLADAALVDLESRYERQAASLGTTMAMTRMINLIDMRSVRPAITVPTLVISRADASEVLVSSTVRDLVAGSGLQFEDGGSRQLKGVPDPGAFSRSSMPDG